MWKNKIMSNSIVKSVIDLFFKKKEAEQAGNNPIVKDTVQKFYDKDIELFSDTSTASQDISINQEDDSLTDMDRAIRGEKLVIEDFLRENVPTIYAFITERVPNMIKVGFTDQGAYTRLRQWQRTYQDAELLGYWTAVELNNLNQQVYFKDFAVHTRLNQKGYRQIDLKTEADAIRQLAINSDLTDMHVSQEFFHKYKDLDEDEKAELSTKILKDIIDELKKDIRENNNLTNIALYTLVGDEGTNRADMGWGLPATFEPTPLQKIAIDNGVNAINNGKTDLLLAAVMRFGKTFTSYQIVKRTNKKFILVTSAKVDVKDAWKLDVNHKDFIDDFAFIEFDGNHTNLTIKDDNNNLLVTKYNWRGIDKLQEGIYDLLDNKHKTVVVFASLPDLAGRKLSDGSATIIKEKHKFLYNDSHPLDLMIIDETHYGSHANRFGVVTGLTNEQRFAEIEQNINESGDLDEEDKKAAKKELQDARQATNCINTINAKFRLQCSGTPYYILQSNEFAPLVEGKEIISTVSFADMIKERDKEASKLSDSEQDKSPYFGIPNITKFGMQLSKHCKEDLAKRGVKITMEDLFSLDNNEKFIHEDTIVNIMQSLFGDKKGNGFLNNEKAFSGALFKHCIMVLPHIDTCPALEKLLIEKKLINTNERDIISLVEKRTALDKGGKRLNKKAVDSITLNGVLNELEKEGKKSLCLTVKRFLTGVSVPLWDCMLYMKDTKSPQEYDQAIFRLCTRNVQTISDGVNTGKINRKPNVYVIDFNVDNMFELAIKSATSQCAAKGQYLPEDIKRTLAEQNEYVPIYAETHAMDNPDVIKRMHAITSEDLLKLYANYSATRSIEDTINDNIKMGSFDNFTNNMNNYALVQNFVKTALGKAGLNINKDGIDDISDIDFNEVPSRDILINSRNEDRIGIPQTDKELKALKREIEEKLKTMIKNIMYCCICLDGINNIDAFIKALENDENVQDVAGKFGIDKENLKAIYSKLNYTEKCTINSMMLCIKTAMDDKDVLPENRMNIINKLGKIDKNEVFTPETITKKMIEKLSDSDYQKANSILLVNEKYGEFLLAIYKYFKEKYDEEMAREICGKCKIIPSSEIAVNFIKKTLNILGLDEYNIMDENYITDVDRNGKYVVKDFLNLENSEIIDMNNKKKFDICLMNPPYGNRNIGDEFLHHKFVEKCLDITNKIICVMPAKLMYDTSRDKNRDYFKQLYDNRLINVEIMHSDIFAGTAMQAVAIYEFLENNNGKINIINKIDNTNKILSSLFEISQFSDYEKNIVKYLEVDINKTNCYLCQVGKNEEILDKWLKNLQRNGKSVFLTSNSANGGMNGTWFSKTVGKIFNNIADLKENFKDRNGAVCIIMLFNSIKAAENCRDAMKRPLLRFGLYRTQDDQNLRRKVYKYIPDINWEDDRVKTDEGLLEVCGCPKNKCKEYADYCKQVIEEVDKK